MEISERKKRVLSAVVEEYVRTAEPVGSKTVQQLSGLTCSSATIRSELAWLEAEGYLEQTHTSSGRIPTTKGYRLYVNELMREGKLSDEETDIIDRGLSPNSRSSGINADDIGKLASELTNYPALAFTASSPAVVKRFDLIYIDSNTFIIVLLLNGNTVRNKLIHLPFSFEEQLLRKLSALFNASFTDIGQEKITPLLISSTERGANDTLGLTSIIAAFVIETLESSGGVSAVVAGKENLLKLPEFQDTSKAHQMISYLSGSPDFGDVRTTQSGNVKVIIGPENVAEELRDSSVILASYDAGDGTKGVIGVIGPTRMDYSKVAAKLSYIAGGLSKLFAGTEGPPKGFGSLMIKGDDSN